MPDRAAPQETLFDLPDPPEKEVRPAVSVHDHDALAARVPRAIRLGGMSWNYPGWRGHVFDEKAPLKDLPKLGLAAYAQHPLFRAVEIDRSAYDPLPAHVYSGFAAQTPDDFRFSVKAHDHLTMRRFPTHARFGKLRGEASPHYFDAAYATDIVIGPTVEGLGTKLGVLLFQCPPQDVGESPGAFATRVHDFSCVFRAECRTPWSSATASCSRASMPTRSPMRARCIATIFAPACRRCASR